MQKTFPRLLFVAPVVIAIAASFTAIAGPGVSPSPTATAASTDQAGPTAPSNTVWLCRPGIDANPCAGDLTSTAIKADGSTSVSPGASTTTPPIDCFYVYPTVSKQKGMNATLAIDPEERAVALAQAAQFSRVCQVYAPIYQQLTLAAIAKPEKVNLLDAAAAYEGVWNAFRDYMAHYNHGRGVVFIGHSQGAFMLTTLLKSEVDSQPDVRKLLVSALLIGGNVMVPAGKAVGGDFSNIPACASAGQVGCVVAYSSFASKPPADSLFGRTDSPLNPFAQGESSSLRVLCVNPAAPAGGTARLLPFLPTKGIASLIGAAAAKAISAKTPFITYPDEFNAHCQTADGATWLQIDRKTTATDRRPGVTAVASPRWGLHMVDVNLALGNLVALVRSEAAAYSAAVTAAAGAAAVSPSPR